MLSQETTLDLEGSLVGAMLQDPASIEAVSLVIRKTDFAFSDYGNLYEHLVIMFEAGKPVGDLSYLVPALYSAGLITREAGSGINAADVAKMVNSSIASNAPYYSQLLLRDSLLRQHRRLATQLMNKASQTDADPVLIAQWVESQMSTIAMREQFVSSHISEFGQKVIDNIVARQRKNANVSIVSGIDSLDDMIGGFADKELTIVAARPGNGKTSFAMQVLKHASECGRKSLFISLEMPGEQIAQRMMSAMAGVDQRKIRSNTLNAAETLALDHQRKNLEGFKIQMFDRERLTAKKIRALAKVEQATNGLDILAIDYIQLIKATDPRMQSVERIGDASESLKDLAKELDIPIIALAQLNRNAEETPKVSHLAGSDKVLQDADCVLLIHNPTDNDNGAADVIVGKNRNGDTGSVRLNWSRKDTTFSKQ